MDEKHYAVKNVLRVCSQADVGGDPELGTILRPVDAQPR